MAELYVGTSGFSYEHWKDGVFYPEDISQDEWLEHYASVFRTVEVNHTFYQLADEKVMKDWHDRTQDDFVFSVKGSRFITHNKKLGDAEEPVENFLAPLRPLGDKLHAILWQLSPRYRKDAERLEYFCSLLDEKAAGIRQAFEFRDLSWFVPEVYDVLEDHGHALVVAHDAQKDEQRGLEPVEALGTDFVYLRLHYGERGRGGKYSNTELEAWAERVASWRAGRRDVYAYFNNDWAGYAPDNAMTLRAEVGVDR